MHHSQTGWISVLRDGSSAWRGAVFTPEEAPVLCEALGGVTLPAPTWTSNRSACRRCPPPIKAGPWQGAWHAGSCPIPLKFVFNPGEIHVTNVTILEVNDSVAFSISTRLCSSYLYLD